MLISVDTGGTFTDCIYLAQDGLHVLKLPSTPADPAEATLRACREIASGNRIEVRHGTTVGTNALLERKGARVAFITTAGFEDVLAIGRQARAKLYDLFFEKPKPIVDRELCFGVAERVSCDGTILQQVTGEELERIRHAVELAQPEAIAVSLLFAFANPQNELAVCRALEPLGVPISASHLVLPEFREYSRASTMVINAYLFPKMRDYLNRLDRSVALSVMQSSGGIISAQEAAKEPVRTILSGPAGGVVGAMQVAAAAGFPRAITFDMGGTSTDVALVDGERGLEITTESQIHGMPVAVPSLRIHTVGAGGGSLAGFDAGGALKVGPESASAVPGPACYGSGERPTVTDADLILGRLDPDAFLGGAMRLDVERARRALDEAKQTIASVELFAEGIVALANAHMVEALHRISVEQGYDPREFTLVSFGGAGPLHACELAQALRIPRVLVPNMPGALSAYGILVSDLIRESSKTVMLNAGDKRIAEHAPDFVDMRYQGQGYELQVPYGPAFVEVFHQLHRRRYGYSDPGRMVEVVNVRWRAVTASEKAPFPSFELRPQKVSGRQHSIYAQGQWLKGQIFQREALAAGARIEGPAVVTEYSATTYLPPHWRAEVDQRLNLILEAK